MTSNEIIIGCKNNYTKTNFTANFFINEDESKICSNCKHFIFSNGIATCDLIEGTVESSSTNDISTDNIMLEG